jgi:ATP-dependent DNA helicase RecG
MPNKSRFDARKLMERAIEVMRESVDEPRDDGKPQPKVGAVIYKPDGTVETACRGELRDGDHAEFTLMERKNRHRKLDSSILLTTLEPCARGARSTTKMSCAERIIVARIKEVWIGIEDPDPKIDRKGIKWLQDHGVEVHMFDRDLQEVIQAENKDFIASALERAAAAKKERPTDVILSELENATATAQIKDFSIEALEQYRKLAEIKETVGSKEFNRRLVQQGLVKQHGAQFIPTGFGLLLFGREPRTVMPQAGLLATIHYPDGREDTRDFDGPMVLIPALIQQWITDKLPNVIDRAQMQRKRVVTVPFEMIREGVINALIHRDYDIRQAKCQIVITANTITVKSPGGPLPPITLKQLQTFKAPMLSRNPELHYMFVRMGMAEERGLGMITLRKRAEELRLPLPKYTFEDPYLVLTLYRNAEGVTEELPGDVLKKLNKDEKSTWQFLVSRESTTTPDVMRHFEFDEKKAQRILRKLMDTKLIRRVGSGPATRYEVRRQ